MASPYEFCASAARGAVDPDPNLFALFAPRYGDEPTLSEQLKDYPTEPWAGRALCEHVLGGKDNLGAMSCLEPACNRMFLSDALWEYFGEVHSTDIGNYGYGGIKDFKDPRSFQDTSYDWVITNPPFSADFIPFVHQALRIARRGVAFIVPAALLGTDARYNAVFGPHPYTFCTVYPQRLSWRLSRVEPEAKDMQVWFALVWLLQDDPNVTQITHIPVGAKAALRRELEDCRFR